MAEGDVLVADVYVQPGESQLVSTPAILRTVLGSCVGVTFRAERLGIAALCHPMLPSYPTNGPSRPTTAAGRRYVDFTIRDIACQFDRLGAKREEVEVKLFGGGDVLLVNELNKRPTVGRLNCERALRVLEDEGFSIVSSSLGGTSGIRIEFITKTGEVRLRRLC
jgi:chemotaxis protein CheD